MADLRGNRFSSRRPWSQERSPSSVALIGISREVKRGLKEKRKVQTKGYADEGYLAGQIAMSRRKNCRRVRTETSGVERCVEGGEVEGKDTY